MKAVLRPAIGVEVFLKKGLPSHVGFIPDGNRRWAGAHGMSKEAGYAYGINPGLLLFDLCKEYGIQEVSIYGFTQDNNKRPSIQQQAFRNACVTFALEIARRGAALLVVGDETSTQFPRELKELGPGRTLANARRSLPHQGSVPIGTDPLICIDTKIPQFPGCRVTGFSLCSPTVIPMPEPGRARSPAS